MKNLKWVLISLLQGLFYFAIIILMILFSTGVESKFIYTDF